MRLIAAALAPLLLAACADVREPQPPCCYDGRVGLARADDLTVRLESGAALPLAEALPGYRPAAGLSASALPFREAEIGLVTYAALRRVLPLYDANANGVMEVPELTVLYAKEAALGLGHAAVGLGGVEPADAVVLAQADLGGLLDYVRARRGEMNPQARAVFAELDLLGRDLRIKDDSGPASSSIKIRP